MSSIKAKNDALEERIKYFRIVGIGASAGGLEAFTELLRHLPPDAGLAYVLVQHLDPTHRSLLSELLGRASALPVNQITDNTRVEANHIYVIPPNCDLALQHGVLKLSPRARNGGPARSIDHFLESLAADQKEQAIAVILSGAGSDGAIGLKAVKAAGGTTFAQDESSAKYNSMPRSAIATGCVDFVLSPEKIAGEIARMDLRPNDTKTRAAANAKRRRTAVGVQPRRRGENRDTGLAWPVAPEDTNLRKIFHLVRSKTGLDFTFYKPNTIRRRLTKRMSGNKTKTLEAYVKLLREQPAEVDALYQDVLIHVTNFFRNPGSFEVLKREIFPKLVNDRLGADPLRIWITGCSTGQEPYSMAMAYAEFAEQHSVALPIQIFATDVNGAVLDKARMGRYNRASVQGVSPQRLEQFFTIEDGNYRVKKSIRDLVIFAQHNLLTDPPFTRVDLVSCRNLLIYLESALQQKIIPTFHYALKPNGILWLGASESIGQFANLFNTVNKSHKLYAKKQVASWLRVERPPVVPPQKLPASAPQLAQRSPQAYVPDAQKESDRLILTKYAPTSVLINEDLEILQFRGDASRYFDLPTGKANFHLLKMARKGLVLPLQKLIQKAKKENKAVREKEIFFDARQRKINIEVIPLKNLRTGCFLILFEKPLKPAKPEKIANGHSNGHRLMSGRTADDSKQLADLRRELAETREQLQSFQEEHETSVEELQASNEEVQSANEELQSLNEELETSNEELESGNEELTTLNEELATRNTELRESELRLREQAKMLDMAPILARSAKDRIIFWSEGAERMYGYNKEEAIGQSIHLLLNTQFSESPDKIQPRLAQDGYWRGELAHRCKDGKVITVASEWVVHYDDQKKIRAILEVNTDITARKEAEKSLRESESFNRGVLESSADGIAVLSLDGRLIFMSPQGQQMMDISDFKDYANTYWPGFCSGEWRTRFEEAIQRAIKGEISRFQGSCATVKGVSKCWDVVISPIMGEEGKPERLLCVSRDITEERKNIERQGEQARLAMFRADTVLTLSNKGDLKPILQQVSELFVQHLDVAFARIWILNDAEQVLELQSSAGRYRHINGGHSRIKVGDFKIGRIAQRRKPHLTNDVLHDKEISSPDWARREGMVAFAGYPLIMGERLLGVIAMFSCKPISELILNEIAFAADSIAGFIQRKMSDSALHEAQEELNRYTQDLEKTVNDRTAKLRDTIGELETFSYSVSHDLRTPLRAMDGYARAILEDCPSLNAEHRNYLERIVRGAERLDRLTLDVLAYSRLSRTDVQPQPVDLNKLVQDIIDQYPNFQSCRSQIEVATPLLPVLGHPAFLTQCLSNILGNAIKFVAAGQTPLVKIWTEAHGAAVRIFIKDNGIGIAPEHQDRMFKLFGRVHSEKTYEGTGIGLAVAKRAVERMGGTIGYESELGKGTRFCIELPGA
jgi:two-component system CheB/CheR fusion protein